MELYIRSKNDPDDLEWRLIGPSVGRKANNFNFSVFDFHLNGVTYTEFNNEWITAYNKIKMWEIMADKG